MFKQASIESFLLSVLIFFTPVVFSSVTNELYEFPKTYFLYTLGLSIIFVFLIKRLWANKGIKLLTWVFWLLILSAIVSTAFSTHFYTSLWGYYSRFFGGFVSTIILFSISTVFINVFKQKDIEGFLTLVSLSGVIPAFFSWFQNFSGIERAYSTFGQPNWASAYLVVCLLLMLTKINKSKWFLLSIVIFGGIWFTYSMSGLVALLSSVLLFLIINKNLIKLHLKRYSLLLFFFLLIIFFRPGMFINRSLDALNSFRDFITSSYNVYAETTYRVSDGGLIRLGIWKSCLDIFLASGKNIVIGTGPQTFPYVFQAYRSPELNFSSEWDYILNRPHNYYIEILVEYGFFGFVTYLIFIYKNYKKLNPLIVPSYLSILITNFFGWPTVALGIVSWLLVSTTLLNND